MDDQNSSEIGQRLKIEYFRVWAEVFREFLGWSPSKVERWSRRFCGMDDWDSLFYHEPALYYAAVVLVPNVIRNGKDPFKFVSRIVRAIDQGDPRCEFTHGFNWGAAKQRVDELLSTVGSSLEQVTQEIEQREEGLKDSTGMSN